MVEKMLSQLHLANSLHSMLFQGVHGIELFIATLLIEPTWLLLSTGAGNEALPVACNTRPGLMSGFTLSLFQTQLLPHLHGHGALFQDLQGSKQAIIRTSTGCSSISLLSADGFVSKVSELKKGIPVLSYQSALETSNTTACSCRQTRPCRHNEPGGKRCRLPVCHHFSNSGSLALITSTAACHPAHS